MALTVKVQLSIVSNAPDRTALIYNKTKTIFQERIATPELIERMNGELKKFFRAHIVQNPDMIGGKEIVLDEELEAESW